MRIKFIKNFGFGLWILKSQEKERGYYCVSRGFV